jgi:hypothetical protein
MFCMMPSGDVSSCIRPCEQSAASLRWLWHGNLPFCLRFRMCERGQSMVFQTYSARLVRSAPLNDLTKHLDFEIQGVPRFGFVPG